MYKKIFAVALLAAFFAALPHHIGAQEDATADAEKALQAKIEKLIEQLGSGEFEERKAAQDALLDIGEDAREELENALKNPDPEVAAAATTVLKQMDMLRFVFVCTDEKGAPLKDKTLTIAVKISQPYDPDKPYTAPVNIEKSGKTAEDGTFSLEPFDGKMVEITAKIDGFATIKSRELKFQSGKYVIPLRFVLAGTVKGVVVDASNKDVPVPDANVNVGENNATTDENGRFEIKGIPPGSHQVYVGKWQMKQETEPQTIDVASGKTTEVKIKMVRKEEAGKGKGFKCRLLKPDGKPLANTRVVIEMKTRRDDRTYSRTFGEESWGDPPATDADGYLLFEEIESGQVTLKIYVAGYLPVETEEHEVKPGESWEIKEPIKLDRGLEIEVVVRDAEGKPVPGAKVITRAVEDGYKHYSKSQIFADENGDIEVLEAVPPGEEPVPGGEPVPPGEAPVPLQKQKPNLPGIADTNDKGAAKVAGLPEGDIVVVVVKPGYVVSGQKTVTLKKGETGKIEIILEKEATAEVKIIDADTKQPVPRANAYLKRDSGELPVIQVENESNSYSSREDESAAQTIHGIRAGKATISASAEGYHESTVEEEFKPGESKSITIKMKPLRDGALTGSIKPAASMPMSEVFCALLHRSDRGGRYGYGEMPTVLRLDRKGRFNMPNVREGGWSITVLGMNDRPLVEKDFEIEPGKKTDIALQLQALGALEIELVDHEGKPAAGTELVVVPQENFYLMSAGESYRFFRADGSPESFTTDENGKCRAEHLIPGAYMVSRRGTGPGWVGIGQIWKANIEADKTGKLKIRIAKTTTLEGTVSAEYKKPCGVMLLAPERGILGMFFMPVAMKQGLKPGEKFELDNIPPGKYIIAALPIADETLFSSYLVEIEVKEGVPVKGIELKFPEKTQKVSGKVKDYKSESGSEKYLLLHGPVFSSTKVKSDGTFEVETAPGKYKVYCFDPDEYFSGDTAELTPVEIEVKKGKDLTGVEIP